MIAHIAASLVAVAACDPLPGFDRVLARPSVNYVLFGEYHGTEEMPAVAGDAACAAAATGRPVVFGVEFAPADQPAIDAYMASDGGAAARSSLLASPGWRETGGRVTAAIADLIERLRSLSRRHAVSVVAFDTARETSGTSARREKAMADALVRAQALRQGSIVIALTGSGHADRQGFTSWTPPFPAAAGHLPADQTVSLTFARPGGRYWGCTRDAGCAEQPMPTREPVTPRGVTLDERSRAGFDGIYSAGQVYTASRPVDVARGTCGEARGE